MSTNQVDLTSVDDQTSLSHEIAQNDSSNAKKTMSQQIFHRGMFTNRPRSNSFGSNAGSSLISLDTITPNNTVVDGNDGWKEVARKRQRQSPEKLNKPKQVKLNYWLDANVSTSNSFSELETEQCKSTEKNIEREAKPPPIYVDKVNNIQPLTKLLKEIVPNEYELKILREDQVKINPKTSSAYTTIVQELKKKNTEFHTFQPKQERGFKVVLKNLHHSTDITEIRDEIVNLGFKVTNIWNMKSSKTKKPMSMFSIELTQEPHVKDIYKVESLLSSRVVFEPMKTKRDIPQCANCQQYGHTKKFCHRPPRCIKCAGEHSSIHCPRKERSDKVKCVLCDGNHPANYKGCVVFKEIQSNRYPTLRKRSSHPETIKPANETPSQNPIITGKTITYADTLKNSSKTPSDIKHGSQSHKQKQDTIPPNQDNSQFNLQDVSKLIAMMQQVMKQLTAMTNVLMTMTSELSHSTR